jgi:hypothetical protein
VVGIASAVNLAHASLFVDRQSSFLRYLRDLKR